MVLKDLDGHGTLKDLIQGGVDRAHAATAQLPLEQESPVERRADVDGHGPPVADVRPGPPLADNYGRGLFPP